VEFWSRLNVPELWRDGCLNSARKLPVQMLVPNIKHVTVTFPMVDNGAEIADAIGRMFDAVLTTSTQRYPGDGRDIADDPLTRVAPLDSRVQVNSMWSTELPDDMPITMFSA
jgi:hypothetical protein